MNHEKETKKKDRDDPYSPTDFLECIVSSESDCKTPHRSDRFPSSSSEESSDDSSSDYEYTWEEAKPAKPPFQPFVAAVNVGAIELPAVRREFYAVIPLKAVLVILFPNNTPEDLEIGVKKLNLHRLTKFEADLLTNHVKGLRDSGIRTFTVGTEIYVAEFSRGEIGCSYESLKTECLNIMKSLAINAAGTVETTTGYTSLVHDVKHSKSVASEPCRGVVYPKPMTCSQPKVLGATKELCDKKPLKNAHLGDHETNENCHVLQSSFSEKCVIAHVGDKSTEQQNCKRRKHRSKTSSESDSVNSVENEPSACRRTCVKSKVAVVLKHLYPENEEDEDWGTSVGNDIGEVLKKRSAEADKGSTSRRNDTYGNEPVSVPRSVTVHSEKPIDSVGGKSSPVGREVLSAKKNPGGTLFSKSLFHGEKDEVDECNVFDAGLTDFASISQKSSLRENSASSSILNSVYGDSDVKKNEVADDFGMEISANTSLPSADELLKEVCSSEGRGAGSKADAKFDRNVDERVVHRLPLDCSSSESESVSSQAEWTVTDSYTCQSPDVIDEGTSRVRKRARATSLPKLRSRATGRSSGKPRSPVRRDSEHKTLDRSRKERKERRSNGASDVSSSDSRFVIRRQWREDEKYGGSGQRAIVFGDDNRIIQRTARFVPDYSKLRFHYRRELYSPVSSSETDFADDNDFGEMPKSKVLHRRSFRDNIRMRSRHQNRETSAMRSDGSTERSTFRSGSAQSKSKSLSGQRESFPRFLIRRENSPDIVDAEKKILPVSESESSDIAVSIDSLVVGIRQNCENRTVRYKGVRSKETLKRSGMYVPRASRKASPEPRFPTLRRRSHSPSCVRSFSPSPRRNNDGMRPRRRSLTPISKTGKVAYDESVRRVRTSEYNNNRKAKRSAGRKGGGDSDSCVEGNEHRVSRIKEMHYSFSQRGHNAPLNDGSHITNVVVHGPNELKHSCYSSPFKPFHSVEFSARSRPDLGLKSDTALVASTVGRYPVLSRPESDEEEVIILKDPQGLSTLAEDFWPFLSSASEHDSSMEDSYDGEVEGFMFRTLKRWRERSALQNNVIDEVNPSNFTFVAPEHKRIGNEKEQCVSSVLEADNTRKLQSQTGPNQCPKIGATATTLRDDSPKERHTENNANVNHGGISNNCLDVDPKTESCCDAAETATVTSDPNFTATMTCSNGTSSLLPKLRAVVATELKNDPVVNSPCAYEEVAIQDIPYRDNGSSIKTAVVIDASANETPSQTLKTDVNKSNQVGASVTEISTAPGVCAVNIPGDEGTSQQTALDCTCIGATVTIEGEKNEGQVVEKNVAKKGNAIDVKSWKKLLLQKAQIDSSTTSAEVKEGSHTIAISSKSPEADIITCSDGKKKSLLSKSTVECDVSMSSGQVTLPQTSSGKESTSDCQREFAGMAKSVIESPTDTRAKVIQTNDELKPDDGISSRECRESSGSLSSNNFKSITSIDESKNVEECENSKIISLAETSFSESTEENCPKESASLRALFEAPQSSSFISLKKADQTLRNTLSGVIENTPTSSSPVPETSIKTVGQNVPPCSEGISTTAAAISSQSEASTTSIFSSVADSELKSISSLDRRENSPNISSDLRGIAPNTSDSSISNGASCAESPKNTAAARNPTVPSDISRASIETEAGTRGNLSPIEFQAVSLKSSPEIAVPKIRIAKTSSPTSLSSGSSASTETSLNNLIGSTQPTGVESSSSTADTSLPSGRHGLSAKNVTSVSRDILSSGNNIEKTVDTCASSSATTPENLESPFDSTKVGDLPGVSCEQTSQRQLCKKEILSRPRNSDVPTGNKATKKDMLSCKMMFRNDPTCSLETTILRSKVSDVQTTGANLPLASRGTFRGPQLKHNFPIQKTVATSGHGGSRYVSLLDQPSLISNRPEFMTNRAQRPTALDSTMDKSARRPVGNSSVDFSNPSDNFAEIANTRTESSGHAREENVSDLRQCSVENTDKSNALHRHSKGKTEGVEKMPLKSILRKPTANFDSKFEAKVPKVIPQAGTTNKQTTPVKSVEESLQEGESVIRSLLPLLKRRGPQNKKVHSEKRQNNAKARWGKGPSKRGTGRPKGRSKKRKRLPSISSDEDIIQELNAGASQPLPKRSKSPTPHVDSSQSEVDSDDDDDDGLLSFMGTVVPEIEMTKTVKEGMKVESGDEDKSDGDKEDGKNSIYHNNPISDFSTDSEEDGKPLSELAKKAKEVKMSRRGNSTARQLIDVESAPNAKIPSDDQHENIFAKLSKEIEVQNDNFMETASLGPASQEIVIEKLEVANAEVGERVLDSVATTDSTGPGMSIASAGGNVNADEVDSRQKSLPALGSSNALYNGVDDEMQPFLPTPPTSPKWDSCPPTTDSSKYDASSGCDGDNSNKIQPREEKTVPPLAIPPVSDDAKPSLPEVPEGDLRKEEEKTVPPLEIPPVSDDAKPSLPEVPEGDLRKEEHGGSVSQPIRVHNTFPASSSMSQMSPRTSEDCATAPFTALPFTPVRLVAMDASLSFVSLSDEKTQKSSEKQLDESLNLIAAAAELAGLPDSGCVEAAIAPSSMNVNVNLECNTVAPRHEQGDNAGLVFYSSQSAVPKLPAKRKERIPFANYSMPYGESCHGFLEVCMSAPSDRTYALRRIPYVKTNAEVLRSNSHENRADPSTSNACATYLRLRDIICLIKVHPEVLFSLVLRCEATLFSPNDYTRRLFNFVYDPVCNQDDDLAKMTMRHTRGERLQEFLDHMIVLDIFLHSLLPRFYHEGLSVNSCDVPRYVSVKIFKPITAINEDVIKMFRRPYLYNSTLRNKDDRIKCHVMERKKFSLPSSNPRKRKSCSEPMPPAIHKAPLPRFLHVPPTPPSSAQTNKQDHRGFPLKVHPHDFFMSTDMAHQYKYTTKTVHSQYGSTIMQPVFYSGGVYTTRAMNDSVVSNCCQENIYGNAPLRQCTRTDLPSSRSVQVAGMNGGSTVIRYTGSQRPYVVQNIADTRNMNPTSHHRSGNLQGLPACSNLLLCDDNNRVTLGENTFTSLSSDVNKRSDGDSSERLLLPSSLSHIKSVSTSTENPSSEEQSVPRIQVESQKEMNAIGVAETNVSERRNELISAPDCPSTADGGVGVTSKFRLSLKVNDKVDVGHTHADAGSPTTKEFLMDLPSILSRQKRNEGESELVRKLRSCNNVLKSGLSDKDALPQSDPTNNSGDENPAVRNTEKLSGIDILAEAAAKVYAMSEDDESEILLKGRTGPDQGINFAHLSGVVNKLQSRVQARPTKTKGPKKESGQKKTRGKTGKKKVGVEASTTSK